MSDPLRDKITEAAEREMPCVCDPGFKDRDRVDPQCRCDDRGFIVAEAARAAREDYADLIAEADEMIVAFEGCMHRMTEDEPACGVCPFCRYRAARDKRG